MFTDETQKGPGPEGAETVRDKPKEATSLHSKMPLELRPAFDGDAYLIVLIVFKTRSTTSFGSGA